VSAQVRLATELTTQARIAFYQWTKILNSESNLSFLGLSMYQIMGESEYLRQAFKGIWMFLNEGCQSELELFDGWSLGA